MKEKIPLEQGWADVYYKAKKAGSRKYMKLAERWLIRLGVIDDPIAEEARVETYIPQPD